MENSKCEMCIHLASCKAWVKHGELLYNDFSYSTEGCEHYLSLVMCKDCKWYKESKYLPPIRFCYRLKGSDGQHVGYNFSDNDFCSYGERRTT